MPPSCDVSPSHEGSCSFGRCFLPVAGSRGRAEQWGCLTLPVPLPVPCLSRSSPARPAYPLPILLVPCLSCLSPTRPLPVPSLSCPSPAHPLPVPCPPPAHLLPVPILSPARPLPLHHWPRTPSRGHSMDDDRPLFTTFKPLGEDSTARAKAAPTSKPSQPQGTSEQSPGHHSRHGRVPPGFWSAPAAQSLPEGEPCPERGVLRARTRLWFEQTQAQSLGPEGELPSWFHGFISRREAEELLQDQPLGCFLVRFSESTVGFVLSYRGRDRCRHFVLDQLPDGRYVILGERSAHAGLAQLLQHHATAPVTPYREFLTVPLPCGRKDEPRGRPQPPAGGDAAHSPASQAAAKLPEYSPVSLEPPRAEGGSAREAPGAPPSLPAKSSSRGAARGLHGPSGSAAPPEVPCAQVHKESALPEPPEAKYQQLMCFHVYAEPREEIDPEPQEPTPGAPIPEGPPTPGGPIPEEPIPFYAMARGWSRCASPEENIYSEVALARQDVPARPPTAPQNTFSTLPPKARPHRRLFHSVSSQDCKRRQLSAAPSTDREDRGASSTGTQAALTPELELDDPVYSRSTPRDLHPKATAENVYEQLPGDCS
ncbi:SH2 domain-containing protein 2A isoform X2 [Serinus canaria]|uniref:SH2 domain-containing protein 2A isoform X2 n=1 Tax=Serinus canaria TaxID=9135 RepID=UPI0021CD06E0|nr:SH2 domain-containing protein 2A isoform X2 [Serinus canaria]